MPGHFTHIYTARRVADWLQEQQSFNPLDVDDGSGQHEILGGGLLGLDPHRCGELMHKWPKYTNVGAVGPDLFFFCQDYSSGPLAAFEGQDDLLMLAMAVYYGIDHAKDEEWEPLLVILAEVDQTFARVVRFLIKLRKAWAAFVAEWDATIGPIVDTAAEVLDDLSGGVLSAAKDAFDELLTALLKIAEEELVTFADIFSWFSLKMRAGWDEQSFLWSDMLHYRKTNQMAHNLFLEAQRQFDQDGDQDKFEQFQAFALGWVCHIGTDVIDHAFVNEQAGGPFRAHWQRHHLVENHIDAWNYRQAGPGGSIATDDIGATELYPDLGRSALVYAVALDEDNPNGWERPTSLPDDRAQAKAAVDQDGFMPAWLAYGIVRALIATYHDDSDPDGSDPDGSGIEPANLGGSDFQNGMSAVRTKLEALLDDAGIHLDQPLDDVLAAAAPDPGFQVPHGYPLPWQVQTSYRFMISFYRLSFWGGFDLDKPRAPKIIEWPPASDFTDLASVPDLSGVHGGDPAEDICGVFLALIKWLEKEAGAVAKLVGDLTKAVLSPGTYPVRWGLYQLAMYAFDLVSNAHEVLAHTGFLIPHGELAYDDGELRQPNEIDLALIQLGNTVDGNFLQALADATDPFGNLDRDPALIVEPTNPRNDRYPLLPVRPKQIHDDDRSVLSTNRQAPNEFRRPWAYPVKSRRPDGSTYDTPTELSDVAAELADAGVSERESSEIIRRLGDSVGKTVSGPYPTGATPDQVMFRTGQPITPAQRSAYERAQTPAHTDAISEEFIGRDPAVDHSPLGDPIPFSAYLMGRILDPDRSYAVDFNLDADRGYGYRCWDWIRGDEVGSNGRKQPYRQPVVQPEGSVTWPGASPDSRQVPVQLHYPPQRRLLPPASTGNTQTGDSVPGRASTHGFPVPPSTHDEPAAPADGGLH